ncbi:hypothetical protein ACHQJC_17260 [Raoultella planticola]|uniref:hypothetical protein n=1 Tax=Raoultella planticola TaxID=575 RepID=UPI003890287F
MGIIFTHGISGNDPKGAEQVNYGVVRNILSVLRNPARIAGNHDRRHETQCWSKYRGERLVSASGLPYTIVRPGWFDYIAPNEHKLVFRLGDTHWQELHLTMKGRII